MKDRESVVEELREIHMIEVEKQIFEEQVKRQNIGLAEMLTNEENRKVIMEHLSDPYRNQVYEIKVPFRVKLKRVFKKLIKTLFGDENGERENWS